jgi:dihydroorotase-like cyclic amidohydrolase
MPRYDTAVLNGTVVVPYVGAARCDVGVRDGRIATLAESIAPGDASLVVDARDRLVLPGAVDSHFHIGIYRDLAADARSETVSALVGGVTTVLSYFRTGQNYLNKSGPYRTIFPEVVAATTGHAHTDFGYHIGVMTTEQLAEVDWLVADQGVGSFKYYMFYKGLNLTSDSTRGSAYTMAETYDLGHLYLLMRQVAEAAVKYGAHGRVSLSLHCEQAELIRVFIEEVKRSGPGGLEGYHRSRPPLTEQLSIAEALVLTEATRCPVNLLHLSSAQAVTSGADGRRAHPDLDIRLETTVHHLALTHATAGGVVGKVNPPIRTEADREALWAAVRDGRIDTVVSDHACCAEADKGEDLWRALPGFGGTALLYPYLLSEGHLRRGLALTRVVELASANPARAFGIYPRKGTIAVGSDADLVVVDPNREQVVTPEVLCSAQDFTPFDGMRVRGWPTHTLLGGRVAFQNGAVIGPPAGRYVRRPAGLHRER